MNDLSSVIKNCKYQLYANDTVIYTIIDNLNATIIDLENNLKHFIPWCKGNALTVNEKKSRYVSLG